MANVVEEEFKNRLARCEFFVGYTAMADEVPFEGALWKNPPPKIFLVPKDHTISPDNVAEKIVQKTAGEVGVIFLPGRKFDETGTRHGRGRGWYDRFLKHAPKEWLRIGLSTSDTFSESNLDRKSWDEPVDWVVVKAEDGWRFYKTGARVL